MQPSSMRRHRFAFNRIVLVVVRICQALLLISAGWFIYWAHFYDMTVWNKNFVETLNLSNHNLIFYAVSIIALVGIEFQVRRFNHKRQMVLTDLEAPPTRENVSSVRKTTDGTRLTGINRALVSFARLSQLILVFSAAWFIYWAHVYEITVWNKTFIETLTSSIRNVAAYAISIMAAVELELEVRRLKRNKRKVASKTEVISPQETPMTAPSPTISRSIAKDKEYMQAARLLRKAGKPINEENLNAVLIAAGMEPDPERVKAFFSSLME